MPDEVSKTVAALQLSLVQINRYAVNQDKKKKGREEALDSLKSLLVTVEELSTKLTKAP